MLKKTRREVRQCDGISISNTLIYCGHTSDIALSKATIRKDSFLFQEEHFNTIASKRTRAPSLFSFFRVWGGIFAGGFSKDLFQRCVSSCRFGQPRFSRLKEVILAKLACESSGVLLFFFFPPPSRTENWRWGHKASGAAVGTGGCRANEAEFVPWQMERARSCTASPKSFR